MPSYYQPTLISHPQAGKEIWGTWFIEECERECLFGVNEPFLDLLSTYGLGSEFYMEDTPYFWKRRNAHRICGPYVVQEAVVPSEDCVVNHIDRKAHVPIVYHDRHPWKGPWLDKSNVTRVINGERITFNQLASRFNYFPFRFRMVRSSSWEQKYPPHAERCRWCNFD